MKLIDIIARRLVDLGVKSVFGLQGGAVVHIFDSFERNGLNTIYSLHEQSLHWEQLHTPATSNIGCCVVTTGLVVPML